MWRFADGFSFKIPPSFTKSVWSKSGEPQLKLTRDGCAAFGEEYIETDSDREAEHKEKEEEVEKVNKTFIAFWLFI